MESPSFVPGSIDAFAADVRLVFSNAILYNSKHKQGVYLQAQELSGIFEAELRAAKRKLEALAAHRAQRRSSERMLPFKYVGRMVRCVDPRRHHARSSPHGDTAAQQHQQRHPSEHNATTAAGATADASSPPSSPSSHYWCGVLSGTITTGLPEDGQDSLSVSPLSSPPPPSAAGSSSHPSTSSPPQQQHAPPQADRTKGHRGSAAAVGLSIGPGHVHGEGAEAGVTAAARTSSPASGKEQPPLQVSETFRVELYPTLIPGASAASAGPPAASVAGSHGGSSNGIPAAISSALASGEAFGAAAAAPPPPPLFPPPQPRSQPTISYSLLSYGDNTVGLHDSRPTRLYGPGLTRVTLLRRSFGNGAAQDGVAVKPMARARAATCDGRFESVPSTAASTRVGAGAASLKKIATAASASAPVGGQEGSRTAATKVGRPLDGVMPDGRCVRVKLSVGEHGGDQNSNGTNSGSNSGVNSSESHRSQSAATAVAAISRVNALIGQLEGSSCPAGVLELLRALDAMTTRGLITLGLLRETLVGKRVHTLCKEFRTRTMVGMVRVDEIRPAVKALITRWKEISQAEISTAPTAEAKSPLAPVGVAVLAAGAARRHDDGPSRLSAASPSSPPQASQQMKQMQQPRPLRRGPSTGPIAAVPKAPNALNAPAAWGGAAGGATALDEDAIGDAANTIRPGLTRIEFVSQRLYRVLCQSPHCSGCGTHDSKIGGGNSDRGGDWGRGGGQVIPRDVLATLPEMCRIYKRGGADLSIRFFAGSNVPKRILNFMFSLTKENMKMYYDHAGDSWCWDDSAKRAELSNPHARFLVAFSNDSTQSPVAFTHFRFSAEHCTPVL